MKAAAIIPARMAATRFPGKPIIPILGIPMIEHVRRRVSLCNSLSEVVVATCDEYIRKIVTDFGGKVVMTKDSHERCTDRIAEASLKIDADIIINVQGDEPLVLPEMLESAINAFIVSPNKLNSVNLVSPIYTKEEFENPNVVKTVVNRDDSVLYMSREPIPSGEKAKNYGYEKLKQLGIVAFDSEFLQNFARLSPTPLEEIESIDMLRALEHGYGIHAVRVDGKMIGVDIPEDIHRAEAALRNDPLLSRYI